MTQTTFTKITCITLQFHISPKKLPITKWLQTSTRTQKSQYPHSSVTPHPPASAGSRTKTRSDKIKTVIKEKKVAIIYRNVPFIELNTTSRKRDRNALEGNLRSGLAISILNTYCRWNNLTGLKDQFGRAIRRPSIIDGISAQEWEWHTMQRFDFLPDRPSLSHFDEFNYPSSRYTHTFLSIFSLASDAVFSRHFQRAHLLWNAICGCSEFRGFQFIQEISAR